MKLLRLHFWNLNSLRGEWRIDFTAAPLLNSGLFAIVGPTGAGKTTVLDSITLALYGRAARYGNEANPSTMMSRHTGRCSAAVEFSCREGVFRSEWQLRCAREMPGGRLQSPERRVIELPSGRIRAQKIEESNRCIEELTGLNYDRFLRSVLLAQGEFAAFLRANVNERTELLQQVTGTQIYEEISKAAYGHAAEAAQKLQAMQAAAGNVVLLSAEERDALEQRIAATESRIAGMNATLRVLSTRIDRERNKTRLLEEQSDFDALDVQWQQDCAAFSQDAEKLRLHLQASPLAPAMAALDKMRADQQLALTRVSTAAASMKECQTAQSEADARMRALETRVAEAESEERKQTPLLDRVEALDREWHAARAAVKARQDGLDRLLATKKKTVEALELARKESAATAHTCEALRLSLDDRKGDEDLQQKLPGLKEVLTIWKGAEETVAREQTHAQAVQKQLAEREGMLMTLGEVAKVQREEAVARAKAELVATQAWQEMAQGITLREMEARRDEAQALEARLLSLAALARQTVGAETRLRELHTEIAELEKALGTAREDAVKARRAVEVAEEWVKARRLAAEQSRLIQSLEAHRQALEDGKPCPVCGALEHPFAKGPAPDPSADATALKAAEAEAKRAATAFRKCEQTLVACETAWDRAKKDAQSAQSALETALAAVCEAARATAFTGDLTVPSIEAAHMEAESCMRELRVRHEKMRDAEETRSACEKARHLAESAADHSRVELARLEEMARESREAVEKAGKRLAETTTALERARTALDERFRDCGETIDAGSDGDRVFKKLEKRAREYQSQLDQLATAARQFATITERVAQLQDQLAHADAEGDSVRQAWETATAQEARLCSDRQELFGSRSVAEERKRLASSAAEARANVERAVATFRRASDDHTRAQAEFQSAMQASHALATHVHSAEVALEAEAIKAGFSSQRAAHAALQPDAVARALHGTGEALETRRRTLIARREANLVALAAVEREIATAAEAEKAEAPEKATLADWIARHEALAAAHTQAATDLGASCNELQNDDRLRKRHRDLLGTMDAARRESDRWARLSHLIGSANGTVFARIAQGLTLDKLATLANAHLRALNPRYSLRRLREATQDNLEIEIIDHYQADAQRPTRSLSGGESFLASLALALGLSELASGRLSIESLFIDEGFGTLDADTLETAMSALENLEATGKTIGMISQVETMKERVCTQIRVSKRENGCSSLEIVG